MSRLSKKEQEKKRKRYGSVVTENVRDDRF
jgi:hypothetical protein